ncbi:RdRP-domain-containing protein [Macrolepiota fuliginosa MF-IS2]|uniref:RNA-dependent RNA polymerase n=1 Tax=Macrolepiota fuliginosa MF-IS2 TaxID=1400762 RepID=A0A9P5XKV0_9AGAR|nr:RdRP-domain-containing protein [Macrolepiota fuliginosa MF-IS2]
MEVFMHNLPLHFEEEDVKLALASLLHGQHFDFVKTNFAVHLHKPRQNSRARTGTFTLADTSVAQKFLALYGSRPVLIDGRNFYFKQSDRAARQEIVGSVSRMPWINPLEQREQKKKDDFLSRTSVSVSTVQFGWHCRDGVYSIETQVIQGARLCFDSQRREMHVIVQSDMSNQDIVAVRQSSIQSISRHFSTSDGNHVLFLELAMPPMFLRKNTTADPPTPYSRMSTFPLLDNPRAIPFVGLALRLVFSRKEESGGFSQLAENAGLRHIQTYEVMIDRRGLFSAERLDLLERNLRKFNWRVAFQLASLLQNLILDTAELLDLLPRIRQIVRVKGRTYTAKFLKEFQNQANSLWYNDDSRESILPCFESTERDFAKQGDIALPVPDDGSYYQSLHVTITPTTMILNGPHPEQSNRVLRRYDAEHQESFLRVTFRDENQLQYRVDRDIDGAEFIKLRFGEFLKNGLSIAGRLFSFLAYSQSALKDHSVWFVKPFIDSGHGLVNAEIIIEGLGTFDNLSYDPTLKFCPARYAARISQAFTATDAAVVSVEEILKLEDIKTPDGKYTFTDGVGTMSKDLARAIWGKLRAAKRKTGRLSDFPHAYQIRYRGSKGMISIDHTLNGAHTIGLRPSMTKFEAEGGAGEQEIEIARAFDKPTAYYLNRPLIMLLEGLGIPYDVFHAFQERAVQETKDAITTLSKAAHLLERHGLGSSFRLPTTMLSLAKLGLDSVYDDPFYTQLLKIAVYHVLRDLKHHARIPIPKAWTLVGVADVHRYLEEDEVFACVKHQTKGVIFLEGQLLISRSPTIHPGDVQLVRAIGTPPERSPFAREPLYNTVVFSIKGRRPLPSCLGGGDLDGDIYNIIPLKDHPWFTPSRPIHVPAEYAPTERKLLDRPSTMDDVADFVMEYIISDVVGIIAINWLIIADQSERGIEDDDCLKLAQLHSDAVDYPKSGRAVDPQSIPRLKFKAKPDWNAPETINPDTSNYYQSSMAIGKLFRGIELDEIPPPSRPRRRARRTEPRRVQALADSLSTFALNDPDSAIFDLVERQVRRFLDTTGPWEQSSIGDVARVFKHFSSELAGIAANYSLSHRNVMLSEEEVIVGTITQKTSQPRARKEFMTKVREMTDTLVKGVRLELEGDDNRTFEDYLKHAWLAWELSFVEAKKEKFGAKSFGWLALGAVFDAMKKIEEHDATELRSLRSGRG